MRFDGILDAIGHTPLVRLRIRTAPDVEVYAKLVVGVDSDGSVLFGQKNRLGHVIAHADTADDVVAELAAMTALDGEDHTEARAA
jgi:hypothetical protein